MYVGLDIGSSLTKMVRAAIDGRGMVFFRDPYGIFGGSAMSDDSMRKLIGRLADDGVSAVGLTGTGAARFKKIAVTVQGSPAMVLRPGVDPIENELRLQADGVRRLLAAEGVSVERLMVVSVGTGTSFTMVEGDAVRPYLPGLAVGGRYIERLAMLVGVDVASIEATAARGRDSDLLVKHVSPDAKFPVSEFVVAAMGRLGDDDAPACSENVVAGAVKHTASSIAGHILAIRQHPGWQWDGTTAFVGTPVEKNRTLRDWLTYYGMGLKLECLFPEGGAFAGAIGAWNLAGEAFGQATASEAPGTFRRMTLEAKRRADTAGAVVRRLMKRGR